MTEKVKIPRLKVSPFEFVSWSVPENRPKTVIGGGRRIMLFCATMTMRLQVVSYL